MALKVALTRDLVTDAKVAIMKTGAIFESAVDEFCDLYVARVGFTLQGDEWLDADGRTLKDAALAYRESHPHSYADRAPEGEELEQNEIAEAMLRPTPGKLGALAKKLGQMRFDKLVKDWGVDVARMKGGTAPEYAGDGKAVIKKASPKNPWSRVGWSLRAQGDCVKAMGEVKAAQIAASAGCKLGSTKPNPNFN
jgi:hypothetical protein